jgi:hypothetical protein
MSEVLMLVNIVTAGDAIMVPTCSIDGCSVIGLAATLILFERGQPHALNEQHRS